MAWRYAYDERGGVRYVIYDEVPEPKYVARLTRDEAADADFYGRYPDAGLIKVEPLYNGGSR